MDYGRKMPIDVISGVRMNLVNFEEFLKGWPWQGGSGSRWLLTGKRMPGSTEGGTRWMVNDSVYGLGYVTAFEVEAGQKLVLRIYQIEDAPAEQAQRWARALVKRLKNALQQAGALTLVDESGSEKEPPGDVHSVNGNAQSAANKGRNGRPGMLYSTTDWDVFISHASEDKPWVRRLANALREQGLRIWYDEFTLRVGDSLRRSIERGLANSRFGIVVLSPNFFAKEWPQRELDGLTARESAGKKIILPIWHHITADEVKNYSPILADKVAVPSDRGLEYVVEKLICEIGPAQSSERSAQTASAKSRGVEPSHTASGPRGEGSTVPARQRYDLEVVHIPAGEFVMGSDLGRYPLAKDNEQPQCTIYLPDYYIARTPITNAQYTTFLRATSRHLPIGWGGRWPLPGKEEHPVVAVSWHDIVAFCDWLQKGIRSGDCRITVRHEGGLEPLNFESRIPNVRLPTEAEWEKAARGIDGRIWPWGDEWDDTKCNTEEGDVRTTTPVTAYPEGASPYGILDMAGNVWEWTRSEYSKYPYDPKDGRESPEFADDVGCVHRGGSYHNRKDGARCAYRDRLPSLSADWLDLGFRVCVVAKQE